MKAQNKARNGQTVRKRKKSLVNDMGQKLVYFLRDKSISCNAEILSLQLVQGP